MQRAERRFAEREGRPTRTLMEADYLLGVADVSRVGALRFRRSGEELFQSAAATGVPGQIELGRLLQATERILRDEETDEDMQLIFAPGSSLGGARPKASVTDRYGRLAFTKFPKETDDYSMEVWEAVALQLAARAGIRTPEHELIRVTEKPALLSRRFDRDGAVRIPFLSALSMMGLKDGDRSSYPELADVLTQHGAQAKTDVHELYRRMVFNVLISNIDDHLRNHGFLWTGRSLRAHRLHPLPQQADRRDRRDGRQDLATGEDAEPRQLDHALSRPDLGVIYRCDVDGLPLGSCGCIRLVRSLSWNEALHFHRGRPSANLRQVVVHLHPQPGVGSATERLLKPHGHFRRYAGATGNDAVKLLARNPEALGGVHDGQAQLLNIRLDQAARMARVLHRHGVRLL